MEMTNEFYNLSRTCAYDIVVHSYQDFLSMFYILPIQDSIKDNIHDVPNYEVILFPIIGFLIMLEQLIRLYQRKELSRFEDCVINVGSAFIFTLARVFMYVVVIELFDYIHRNYGILHLELHSVWTWLFSLLLVEFVYYWTHRALHEFNILWAAHQFHHMAEDINITTTVRDSVVDLIIYDLFPIPLAFLLPAQILAVHIQFSLIYQVWLHNDVVGHLGPLEYIINTPRQHRVHHGKNPYCIDKNYGALLMIWDRLFGTYQEEDRNEKIVFGCVAPTPNTFDPMFLQFGYYKDVYKKFNTVEGFSNKMSALFKGPGWQPGKPRLGLISDVPQPDYSAPKYTYTPYVAVWKKVYVYVHSFIVVIGFYLMADHPLVRFSPMKGFLCMMYVIYTLTSFGAMFDNRWFSEILEISRCIAYLAFDYYVIYPTEWKMGNNMQFLFLNSLWIVRAFHAISIIFWLANLGIRIYSTGKLFSADSSKDFNCIMNNNSDNNSDSNKSVDVELKCNGNGKSASNEKDGKEGVSITRKSPNNISVKIYLLIVLLTTASAFVFLSVYFLNITSCNQLLETVHLY